MVLQRRVILFLLMVLLSACAGLHRFSGRQIDKLIDEKIPAFQEAFTGFTLLDPESGELLYSHYGQRYFNPASNTKILTLYTALRAMGDSIPLVKYRLEDGQLTLLGTGCPAFLHPELPGDTLFVEFLKSRPSIGLYFPTLYDEKYGPGWAWDDHGLRFQTERSSFPIYGNSVSFGLDSITGRLTADPEYFQPLLQKIEGPHPHPFLRKRQKGNIYEYGLSESVNPEYFNKRLPFRYSEQLFTNLLSDFTGAEVQRSGVRDGPEHTVYYPWPDSLYAYFMHESDNFIAEQLLLQSAWVWTDSLSTQGAIDKMMQTAFRKLPGPPQWVDGSGLSRYNLLTPESIVGVLDLIYDNYSAEQWQCWFPAGGRDGTVAGHYGGNPPWLYAKTGTNRNNHCLSGFLITRKGKVLLFSFMNNHFAGSSERYKQAMEHVLLYIRDSYK